MKKTLSIVFLLTFLIISIPTLAYAGAGTMGFHGGISEGSRMPTTIERLLDPSLNGRRNIAGTYSYKEMVFLSGIPSEFEGTLIVNQNGGVSENNAMGSFTVTNIVQPNAATGNTIIDRNITFNVNYRRESNQVIKSYEVTNWDEFIVTPDGTFDLDPDQSYFTISIIEDHNPGIMFYRGAMSKRAVFIGDGDEQTIVESSGVIYGFDSAWSSTETHRIDTWLFGDGWQMSYQVRPSVSVTKSMQYSSTSPIPISFAGNYMEILQNQSALTYNIFIVPQPFHFIESSGSTNIPSRNTFEQLIAPDTSFLRGHFAEEDIRRLFAMQILRGEPSHFQPNQMMTRGEFVQALTRAIRLPAMQATPMAANNPVIRVVFPDVLQDRSEYPYIMAAFRSGLAFGRNNGHFNIDSPIPREEAIVILVRSLGLENLAPSITPVTAFADSHQISDWALREIQASHTIGLITGDQHGNFRPRDYISKAEGAAFINRFIDYMREDLVIDYSERMINFVN